jgi:hypothetical protein
MSIFEAELQKAYAQTPNKPADLDQFRGQMFGLFDAGSNQLLDVIFAKLQGPKGVHLETAVGAASSLAGAMLLRVSGLPIANLKPGAPVFSDAVNESGPEMLTFMQVLSQQMGIPPFSGWDEAVPDDHRPLQSLVELVRELEKPFSEISQKLGVPAGLCPYMAAMGAIKIIKMGESTLSPEITKAVALSSLMAGSKTVPYPL